MTKKFIIAVITFALLATLGSISPGYAQQIVVPPQFTNQNDFDSQSIFDCADLPNGVRVQVLFPANDLIAGTIAGASVRQFQGSPGFGPVVVPNVTYILSTTDVEPGNLSNTFDDNTGPNPVTVFTGDLNIGPEPACNTDPCPFADPVIFQTPFQYNPANGNLLLEIIVPPCVGGIPPQVLIDSTNVLDGIFAANSNSDSGDDGFGNITEFIFVRTTNVPTLSEWGMITMVAGFGLIGFFVARRRKSAA